MQVTARTAGTAGTAGMKRLDSEDGVSALWQYIQSCKTNVLQVHGTITTTDKTNPFGKV